MYGHIRIDNFLVDTIFRNFPCPPIFLHKDLDDNGKATFRVVDGKQRLKTIIDFSNNEFPIANDFGDADLDGKYFNDLDTSKKRIFWDYVLAVDYFDDVTGNTVNEVFDRVNRNQKKLERQELRHARYDGWFVRSAEEESKESEWSTWKISTNTTIRRMKDVQFISELMLIILDDSITGFSQDMLDEKYAEYDSFTNDTGPITETDYLEEIQSIKEFISSIESHNQVVSKKAKTLNNFYILWAYAHFHRHTVTDIQEFAVKLDTFLGAVKNEKSSNEDSSDQNVVSYAASSLGASTDSKQRQQRLVALLSYMG